MTFWPSEMQLLIVYSRAQVRSFTPQVSMRKHPAMYTILELYTLSNNPESLFSPINEDCKLESYRNSIELWMDLRNVNALVPPQAALLSCKWFIGWLHAQSNKSVIVNEVIMINHLDLIIPMGKFIKISKDHNGDSWNCFWWQMCSPRFWINCRQII